MATKFDAFLSEKKINPLRILAASSKIEKLRPEDRAIRLQRKIARKSEDGAKKKDEKVTKPRSGHPVTQRTINAAIAGKEISGPAKTRILRAVNHLLEQKKLEAVALTALFDAPTKGNKGPKPKVVEEAAS